MSLRVNVFYARFFNVEVRTSDNVKMRLEGTIFWQVKDNPYEEEIRLMGLDTMPCACKHHQFCGHAVPLTGCSHHDCNDRPHAHMKDVASCKYYQPIMVMQWCANLIAMTADPAGDVSQRARSGLVSAVSQNTFSAISSGILHACCYLRAAAELV